LELAAVIIALTASLAAFAALATGLTRVFRALQLRRAGQGWTQLLVRGLALVGAGGFAVSVALGFIAFLTSG
jgi:hypothetical protein